MWSHLYEREAKHAVLTGDSSSLAKPAAFSLTDARALDSLTYLDDVLEWETNQSLTKLIEILEDTSKANLENPEVLVAKLGGISPYRADLVREAGNLNFSHIAEVLTDTTGNSQLEFLVRWGLQPAHRSSGVLSVGQ